MTMQTMTKTKNIFCIFCLFIIILSVSACDRPETASENKTCPETGQVTVADFQQMRLPIPLTGLDHYTTDGKWFYITRRNLDSERTYQILRGNIENDYEGAIYLSKKNALCLALSADQEHNCYVLWKEESIVSLEKFDESGTLLWHVEQSDPHLANIGPNSLTSDLSIAESIVTTEGRLALYTQGVDNLIVLFDENGKLLQITTWEPGSLDGISRQGKPHLQLLHYRRRRSRPDRH